MNARGLTLLEVLIATAILAVVFSVVYMVVFASTGMGEKEMALRDAQFQLHLRMDQVSKEMRESSQTLVRVQAFNDPKMPTTAQTVLVILSARDQNEQFQVVNARPQWQKLVVYASVYDDALKTGVLRRYVVSPVPEEFLDEEASPPTVAVTPTEIQLGTVSVTAIARNTGDRLLTKFDYLKAEKNGNSVAFELSVQGGSILGSRTIDLGSEVKGRN